MKTQIFGACGRYIQGYGILKDLEKHIGWMGDSFLVVASAGRIRDLSERVKAALPDKRVEFLRFDKEITWEQIHKVEDQIRAMNACAVIGMGGGKIADTVKVAAHTTGIRVVIVPTIAASDASTSATSLIYRLDGTVEEVLCFPHSPDVVLADTEVLLQAPVRLFVAGMGDAMSTYIGGKVCQENFFDNHFSGAGTATAMAIAKLSYELLMKYGRQAKIAAERKALTDAFNIVTEVNILMSGLGFENNGTAADHCYYFGTVALTHRPHYVYHGEGVAFSTCCQLVMQGSTDEQLDEVFGFCRDVGLPITFDDMHLPDLTEAEYDQMAEGVLREPFIHHHPYPVTAEIIKGAYKTVDAIGHLYHDGGSLLRK